MITRTFKRTVGSQRTLGGVLGGMAYSMNMSANVVRVIFVLLAVLPMGVGWIPLLLMYGMFAAYTNEWSGEMPDFKE